MKLDFSCHNVSVNYALKMGTSAQSYSKLFVENSTAKSVCLNSVADYCRSPQITADQDLAYCRSVHNDCRSSQSPHRSVRNTADQVLLTTDQFTMFVCVHVFIFII